jgi:hypothetical protein
MASWLPHAVIAWRDCSPIKNVPLTLLIPFVQQNVKEILLILFPVVLRINTPCSVAIAIIEECNQLAC